MFHGEISPIFPWFPWFQRPPSHPAASSGCGSTASSVVAGSGSMGSSGGRRRRSCEATMAMALGSEERFSQEKTCCPSSVDVWAGWTWDGGKITKKWRLGYWLGTKKNTKDAQHRVSFGELRAFHSCALTLGSHVLCVSGGQNWLQTFLWWEVTVLLGWSSQHQLLGFSILGEASGWVDPEHLQLDGKSSQWTGGCTQFHKPRTSFFSYI